MNHVTSDFATTCAERRDPSTLESVLVYQMIRGVWPSAFLSFAEHYGNWTAAEKSYVTLAERSLLAMNATRENLALEFEHMVYASALTASLYTRDFHNFLNRLVKDLSASNADARAALVLDIEAALGTGVWHASDIDVCMHTLPVPGKFKSVFKAALAFRRVIISAAMATCTVKIYDPAVAHTDSSDSEDDDFSFSFNYSDIAADAATTGGVDTREIEDAIYNLLDAGMDPDTAIAAMDSGGSTGFSKYWIKCSKLDEPLTRVPNAPVIDQYRRRIAEPTWVDDILTVRAKLLDLEAETDEAEGGLFGD
jgi:hypothetical protein